MVSIIVLLGALITPTYQTLLSQLQLSASVSQVAEEIRTAQQKTVSEQQIYGLTFTAGATSITLFSYNAVNGTKTTISTYPLPSNISITQVNFSGNADVRFATSGAPNYSGNLVLTDAARSVSRKVEVRPSGTVITSTGEF